jgi:predicted tellurium resistance membrane protein TerC
MNPEILSDPDTYVSLLTLTAMEVVLGIDNIVFISILTGKLPSAEQPKARQIGLLLALVFRLGLLAALSWIMGLTAPLFTAFGFDVSGRHLILLAGGAFLVGKSTHEIYEKLEVDSDIQRTGGRTHALGIILLQIVALDVVFSLDSVITAVGMAQELAVMVAAMVIAVGLMLVFARSIGDFVNRHPSMKILALSFLLLIGVMLVAEGLGQHISKAYIYFAMGFALVVEILNMRLRKNTRPVALNQRAEPVSAERRANDLRASGR